MTTFSEPNGGGPVSFEVILGLGSNLGDSRRIVLDAVKALEEIFGKAEMAPLYETAPLHVTDQNPFINTALKVWFSGTPRELLAIVNETEARFGRNRAKERRWGERFLDIDILLFGDIRVNESDLVIPHPRLQERRFALEPLVELAPGSREPATGLLYRDICKALPDQGVRRVDESPSPAKQ